MASPPLLVNVMGTVTLQSKDASAVSIVATNAVLWQACAGKVSLSVFTLRQCLTVYLPKYISLCNFGILAYQCIEK